VKAAAGAVHSLGVLAGAQRRLERLNEFAARGAVEIIVAKNAR